MHSGLNLPNNELSTGGREVQQVAREIAGSALLSTLPAASRAKVAVVFDYETQWMFEIQRHGKTFDYQTLAFDYYEALRELGLDVDIVCADGRLLRVQDGGVPSLAVIDQAMAARIAKSDAQWVFGPRCGSKTATFTIPGLLPPGRVAGRVADAGARSRIVASDAANPRRPSARQRESPCIGGSICAPTVKPASTPVLKTAGRRSCVTARFAMSARGSRMRFIARCWSKAAADCRHRGADAA